MKLLALDTSTELCSAALWLDGAVSSREAIRERGHSELILPMIDQLLREAAVDLRQLDAIAFGRGPGAFTGVRLAAGVAQGLGFAAGLPLLPVSDLRALAAQALLLPGASSRALICQDARMEECYWGCFERVAGAVYAVTAEAVAAPSELALPADWAGHCLCGAGSGFAAYRDRLEPLIAQLSALFSDFRPRAREVALLAAQDGLASAVPAEQAQPVYLRDEVARTPA
ncbi:MAG: tRNA (adenosine(37)-N6)-threonylcarbamoyltransferase complex dimerization subunit type 1 TsaB [Steroidobacterales bacterium]